MILIIHAKNVESGLYSDPRINIIKPEGNQLMLESAFDNAINRELARNSSPESLQRLMNQGLTEEQAKRLIATRNKTLLESNIDLLPFKSKNVGGFQKEGMFGGLNENYYSKELFLIIYVINKKSNCST